MMTTRHGNILEERHCVFIACTMGAVNVVSSDSHDAELLAVCRDMNEAIQWVDSRHSVACPSCDSTDIETVHTFDGPVFECCDCGHDFQQGEAGR